jgi:hypothetical protein
LNEQIIRNQCKGMVIRDQYGERVKFKLYLNAG